MDVEIKVKDNSRKVLEEMKDSVERALVEIGEAAETYAKLSCPVGTPESTGIPGYIGGTLRGSITYATHTRHSGGESPAQPKDYAEKEKPKEGTVVIGTNVYYGPYVELGTTRMRARPFLKTAIQNHVLEYKRILEWNLKRP